MNAGGRQEAPSPSGVRLKRFINRSVTNEKTNFELSYGVVYASDFSAHADVGG